MSCFRLSTGRQWIAYLTGNVVGDAETISVQLFFASYNILAVIFVLGQRGGICVGVTPPS